MDDEQSYTSSCDMLSFSVKSFASDGLGPRLGNLIVKGRNPIPTPNYIASTSRGVVPHVTQDVLSKKTNITAIYVGLEDFIEKRLPHAPLLKTPTDTKLQDFIASSERIVTFLGPRRIPRLEAPSQNTNSSISISTSVGFGTLSVEDYVETAAELRPDIMTSVVDLVTADKISGKRIEKSADRSHAWLRDTLTLLKDDDGRKHTIFASIPPLEKEQQTFYLSDLADEFASDVHGVCLYNANSVEVIPKSMSPLPRMCLDDPSSPQDILKAVIMGVDLITLPMVTRASESGIAFNFELVAPDGRKDLPLGFDLWTEEHATDLSPLVESCTCYTCTRHHRAFIYHLLSAKEMLAWTLLQVHNYHMIDQFFNAIRDSITDRSIEGKAQTFTRAYTSTILQGAGAGPRIRGYQVKSVGRGEPKRNAKAYGRLDEQAMKVEEAESGMVTPDLDAADIEEHGLATTVKEKS